MQRKKLLSLNVLVPAAISLISGALFVWLAQEVVVEKSDLFDTVAFTHFQQWQSPAHTKMALLVTRGGSDAFLIAVYLVILYCLLRSKCKRQAVQLVIVVAASFLWNWLLKLFFHRARPLPPHLDYVTSAGPFNYNMKGRQLKTILINDYNTPISLQNLPGGMYLLQLANGSNLKILQQK